MTRNQCREIKVRKGVRWGEIGDDESKKTKERDSIDPFGRLFLHPIWPPLWEQPLLSKEEKHDDHFLSSLNRSSHFLNCTKNRREDEEKDEEEGGGGDDRTSQLA